MRFKQIILITVLMISGCSREFTNPWDPAISPNEWVPKDLIVEPLSDDQVKISWKSGTNVATLYSVERKTGSGEYVEIGTTGSTEFIDSTVSVGITGYTYRVMALADERSSDPTSGKKISWVDEGTILWEDNLPDAVNKVIFSNDGKKLFVATGGGIIRIYDVYSGDVQKTITVDGLIQDMDINNEGTKIVAGTMKSSASDTYNMLVLVDVSSGTKVWSHTYEWQVVTVKFSSDGKTVASGCYDKKTRLNSVKSGSELWNGINTSYVSEVDISPDLEFVASASWDKFLRVWDYSTGNLLWEYELESSVWKVKISHDNSYIVIGDNNSTLSAFDSHTGSVLWQFQGAGFIDLNISEDDTKIVSAHQDKTLCFTKDGALLWESDKVGIVHFNDVGDRVCVSGSPGLVTVLDTDDGTSLWTGSHSSYVGTNDFCPDNLLLATGDWDQMIKIWISKSGWILSEKLGE